MNNLERIVRREAAKILNIKLEGAVHQQFDFEEMFEDDFREAMSKIKNENMIAFITDVIDNHADKEAYISDAIDEIIYDIERQVETGV